MRAAMLYIPTETLAPGQRIMLYGPGADRLVDWAAGMAGGRRTAFQGRSTGIPGGNPNLPSGVGASGTEERALVADTPALCFGTYQCDVEVYDPETHAAVAGTKDTVSVFVNSSPRPASNFTRSTASVPVGVVPFSFTPSEDLA